MKHIFIWFGTMFLFSLWTAISFAQGEPTPTLPGAISLADWINMAVIVGGGVKGMSTLGVAAALSQLLLKMMGSPLAKYAGKYKLVLITLLTLVSGVTGLMLTTEMSVWAAMMNSASIVAFQVFVHQIYVQFVKKGDEK